MCLHLRLAVAGDAAPIAQVKDTIWPEEATTPDYIAQVIQQPDHQTIIALDNSQVVGFVDSFITLGPTGQRRWEVDLLAVHPAYQGRGIGSQLVQATTMAGWQMSAAKARGLVAIQNRGSQKAFARAGYEVEEQPFNLWVSSIHNSQLTIHNSQLSLASHLIPVITLNYRGIWLEGQLSAATLRAAQTICARLEWSIAGVLVPIADTAGNEAAHNANYAFVNQFHFWQHDHPDTSLSIAPIAGPQAR